jgi:hypothetical protein
LFGELSFNYYHPATRTASATLEQYFQHKLATEVCQQKQQKSAQGHVDGRTTAPAAIAPAQRGKGKKARAPDGQDPTPAERRAGMTWAQRSKSVSSTSISKRLPPAAEP